MEPVSILAYFKSTKEEECKKADAFLSKRNCSPIDISNQNEVALFYAASMTGAVNLLKIFIDSGFPIDSSLMTAPQALPFLKNYLGCSALHFAMKFDRVNVVQFLLEHGANVNKRDSKNKTALHLAILSDLPELTQLLLQHGADLTLKDSHGDTPLHFAFEERKFKIMDMLLTAHMNVNENPTNPKGISHFHIACARNNVDFVQHFLNNGVSVNICVPNGPTFEYTSKHVYDDINWFGCSSLHIAVAFNMPKTVELLLSAKADVKIQETRGWTALHLACRYIPEKYEELIENSLPKSANANVVSPQAKAEDDGPLCGGKICKRVKSNKKKEFDWSSNRKDQLEIIKMLLSHKSDVNCHDIFGNTPVFYAYVYYALDDLTLYGEERKPAKDSYFWEMIVRRKSMMSLLLRHKVDFNTCHENGSILHFMVNESVEHDSLSGLPELQLLEMFLKKGLATDTLNEKMLTPLFILVQKTARTDFIELLIKHGANVNFQEPEKHLTPLHVALENNYDREQLIFDAVLRGGADPNAKLLDGTTVLHYLAGEFVHYGHIFKRLIRAGADVNARDEKGRTPLFRACGFFNNGLAKMLLENGANINIEDNEGKTVLCVMYEKLVKEGYTSRYDGMVCDLFDVLVNHVNKNRGATSDKVLTSCGKAVNYIEENVNSSFRMRHE